MLGGGDKSTQAKDIGEQLKYTRLNDGHSSQMNRKAFDLLVKARVLHKIPACDPSGLPLGATANQNKFKEFLKMESQKKMAMNSPYLFLFKSIRMLSSTDQPSELTGFYAMLPWLAAPHFAVVLRRRRASILAISRMST